MHLNSIQDILPMVQLPSRYLGNEVNSIKKAWDATTLHIVLAFPDLYEIGTSHFGVQILYNILNYNENIMAERVFAPAVDMEMQLREHHVPLSSLESQIPIGKFDIIGFSLLYELNYTNMVNMLDLGNIPFFAKDRLVDDPFVIGGGPCTCNPEPIADFFDAIVVGDGEAVILQMANQWEKWKKSGAENRELLLEAWASLEGVYIPLFFNAKKSEDTIIKPVPTRKSHQVIHRAILDDMNKAQIPEKPILPFGRPVHDRLRMEIARGCTRGCRFCQAGMIYRPVRERHPERIIDAIKAGLVQTGYEDVSLLSLSSGDYSCISPLMKSIMEFGEKDRVAVSLPSLRAGSLTPELMDLIRKVRKTGFTIAPEAGSQRLRDVINKNITEKDIIETVENAFNLGWKLIKLYFMIGLPTETQDDIKAIVDLVERIRLLAKGRGRINVSVATFVPKPHTPFQWEAQIDIEHAQQKLQWLKSELKHSNLHVKWQDPYVSRIEAVWARGDRQLSRVLIEAWKAGCRFDGWSDFFNYERWIKVFRNCDINPERYTRGWLDLTQPLPWDHIDIGVEKNYLIKERQGGYEQRITKDCRTGECSGCGVCDFKKIFPISYHTEKEPIGLKKSTPIIENSDGGSIFKYALGFKKTGTARYLAHLEMVKAIIRSVRRARIPIQYSGGFHPMPKISFVDTLPMGMESEEEIMLLCLTENMQPEDIVTSIGKEMPNGFKVTGCWRFQKNQNPLEINTIQSYSVKLKDGFFRQNDLDSFFSQDELIIEKRNKRGKRVYINLKKSIVSIEIIDPQYMQLSLKKYEQQTVRPVQVLQHVFHLDTTKISRALITKKKNDV